MIQATRGESTERGPFPAASRMNGYEQRTPLRRTIVKFFAALGLLMSAPDSVFSYDFTLSETEFAAWPRWCQELYVTTDVGRRSPFVTRISHEAMTRARTNPQINGFWHYCAGITWLARARAEPHQDRAAYMYSKAIDETTFCYAPTPSNHPLRGEMGTTLGLAYRGLKDYERAKEFLERAIKEEPTHEASYTAMYLVLRELGRNDEARDALLRGNETTKGKSAELNYFLGLAYIDAGDLPSARKYANQAYKLGYPLPGLRNKLARLEATRKNEKD